MIAEQFARHPWSTDFEWRSPRPPFRLLTADQAGLFDEFGYLILEDAIPLAVIERIRDELDGFVTAEQERLRRSIGQRGISQADTITFTGGLVRRSPTLREFALQPLVADICLDLIGPDADLVWDQAVYKQPEKPRRFPWHQDNGYTFAVDPHQYLTLWVALTDATEENGCPQFVPGAHRLGPLAHHYVEPLGYQCVKDPEGSIVASVRAGGVVIFTSLMPHMTGPNLTPDVRKGYIMHYGPAGQGVLVGDPTDTTAAPTRMPFAHLRPDYPAIPIVRAGHRVEEDK